MAGGKWKAKLNPDAAKAVKKSAPTRSAMFSQEPETNKFHRTMQIGGAPVQEELAPLESSDKLGMSSKRLSTAPDLTSLVNFGDYFGGAGASRGGAMPIVDEENASMEGNVSDYDDDPADDAYLKLLQRDEASAVIDQAPRNDQDMFFKPWEDLVNEAMPGEGAVGEGSASPESLRGAAEAGLNPNWHSTETRNVRDAKFLPFQQGGDESATRSRPLPESIGQGLARRELGMARERFNAGMKPGSRLAGPLHDGTPGNSPADRARIQSASARSNGPSAATRAQLARFRAANTRSDHLEDVQEGLQRSGTKAKDASSWMRFTPLDLTRDRSGDSLAAPIAEVSAEQEDDLLTSGVRKDHFSAETMDARIAEQEAAEAAETQRQNAQAAADEESRIAAGGMTAEQERAIKGARNPKKAKLYARMEANKAKRAAAAEAGVPEPVRAAPRRPQQGLMSRMGDALAKAGRVMSGAFSAAGKTIGSWFGSRSQASAPDTSTAMERVAGVREEEANEAWDAKVATHTNTNRLTFDASSPDYMPENLESKYGRLIGENHQKSRENFSQFAEGYRSDRRKNEESRQKAEFDAFWAANQESALTPAERAARLADGEGQATMPDTNEPFPGMPSTDRTHFDDPEMKAEQQRNHQRMLEAELAERKRKREQEARRLKKQQDSTFVADRAKASAAVADGDEDQATALHGAGISGLMQRDYF